MATFYDILELPVNATVEDIKKAYKRLAIKHHPDKNDGDSNAEERFKLIGEAYKTLSSLKKRMEYNRKMGLQPLNESTVNYTYHQGGLYRSIFRPMASRAPHQAPQVFQSKKKDVDFYLFWTCLALVLLLASFFLFYTK